jgi:hypothetical protein
MAKSILMLNTRTANAVCLALSAAGWCFPTLWVPIGWFAMSPALAT